MTSFWNRLIRATTNNSWNVPERISTNQETPEDDFQSDPHPEASTSQSYTTRSSGPQGAHNMTAWVPKEITLFPWNVFGQTEENQLCKSTAIHSENTPGPSAVGKQHHFCKFQ